jgi:hypothetical protein
MAVTCVGGWRAESERETEHTASNWSWLAHDGTWLQMRRTVQNKAAFACADHYCGFQRNRVWWCALDWI